MPWLRDAAIGSAFIAPESPWQNGSIDYFNGNLRGELLNQEWLRTRDDTTLLIERSRQSYNEQRPKVPTAAKSPATVQQVWLATDKIQPGNTV